jgi:DNA-binding transcriptional ArsR family regulator
LSAHAEGIDRGALPTADDRLSSIGCFRETRRGLGAVAALTGPLVSISLPFVQTYRADGWTALGDPTRRAILEHLAERPRAVGELAAELPVSRPAVSQHLRVLKDAGLVVDRPEGTRRIYQVDPDGVAALRADLDRFWSSALAAFKAAVERDTKGER